MAKINQLHAKMHAMAEEMVIAAQKNKTIDEEQFDEFMEAQSLFFSLTSGLLRSAIEDSVKRA